MNGVVVHLKYRKIPGIFFSNKATQGSKPSVRVPNLSGFSGSVSGFLVLLLVSLNQHPAVVKDGEGIKPLAHTGDD